MKQFFERTLKVYSHEFGRFIWLSGIFLAIFFVTAIFRNYVDTAFLKRFGPEYIPWMLVISAVLTMVVLSFADRIARSSSDSQLMSRLLVFYAAGSCSLFPFGESQVHLGVSDPVPASPSARFDLVGLSLEHRGGHL